MYHSPFFVCWNVRRMPLSHKRSTFNYSTNWLLYILSKLGTSVSWALLSNQQLSLLYMLGTLQNYLFLSSLLIRVFHYIQIWLDLPPARSFPRMNETLFTGNVGLIPTTTSPVVRVEFYMQWDGNCLYKHH